MPYIKSLTVDLQLNETIKRLGFNVSSALAAKFIILDKIGRVSDFVEVVLKIGGAFAEVCINLSVGYRASFISQLSSSAKIIVELAKTLFEVGAFADEVTS